MTCRISKQDKLMHQYKSAAAVSKAAMEPAIPTSTTAAFFEGVHVYVNGYTEPDSLAIKSMLAAHGGVWEQYNGRCSCPVVPAPDAPIFFRMRLCF
jgi:hypothetical protein